MGARPGARAPTPQIREKYFFFWGGGNYCVKFGHFTGKNHVEFGKFVNFSDKYNKNSDTLINFRATRIMYKKAVLSQR